MPAGNPVVAGATISSAVQNTTLTDIRDGITASLARDGQTVPSANLPMGTFRHTGVSDGAARDQYASIAQLQDAEPEIVGSVAGTNAITGSMTPAITAYATGMRVVLIPVNTCTTGVVTLALNGLSAIDIKMSDGNNLIAGDLVAGVPVVLLYTGTVFIIASNNHIAGSFTVTLTGVSGTVTGSASYVRHGRHVALVIPQLTGTSDSTAMTLTGMPAAITPSFEQVTWGGLVTNNGAVAPQRCDAFLATSGVISLALNGSTTGWTSSGSKGFAGASILNYVI